VNKKDKIRFHKITVLTDLLLLELDEMKPTAILGVELHRKAQDFSKALEPFLEMAFKSKQVSSTTYFTEISNKVDTIIRKSYNEIVG
jgi:hypothetical protein